MNTCTLNVLHDSRDQNILAITYRIHFDLLAHQIFINEDRMLLMITVDHCHKFYNILIIHGNLHTLAPQYIGRTDKHRISKFISYLKRFFCCKDSVTLCTRNAALLQNIIKKFSILRSINVLCAGS